MGQSVAAVAFGVKMNKSLEKKVAKALQDPEDGEWIGFEDEGMHGGPNADDPMMGKFDVLGFVVAIDADNSEHPGARVMYPMPSLPLNDVPALERAIGKKAIAEGKRKWAKLAEVAQTKGLALPAPGYILTTVETA